ncbi:auxin response factor 1 isoform X1 [Gossypium australe]|uniref:Auxin response factor 1 isoform X1 n=1 Tax=Gossypium australe TaxID=47621 RepID=A0A5B6WCS5_9ROSI|nr:auxin response factor 1 isoform X1 [Gossypium australe]
MGFSLSHFIWIPSLYFYVGLSRNVRVNLILHFEELAEHSNFIGALIWDSGLLPGYSEQPCHEASQLDQGILVKELPDESLNLFCGGRKPNCEAAAKYI